ncbi:MAG: diacylglycerol kinase family lipid kinase [Anaerolineae bacterium]|jgi:diacylglycerol kinase (ATP)|nr:diacylglycerol kinase family lipid kinase [Anaerolineae bacterium]MBT7074559.1 diacylglycerol kinase family lipid kinase [Anaerolineae bacterium]MBT7783248.1 diacylglycerol kinase family lipid kinase [Anaerolineae bacterium]
MVAKIILNPYSARWGAKERFPEAVAALESAGVAFDVARSKGRNDCMKLAEEAVNEGFSTIIAAGGDGTIGEVVNGMAQATPEGEDLPTFGIIPLGTANDLICNLNMPTDLNEAAKIIAAGKTRQMDLCAVNGRFFANNAAIGLEPQVTITQEKIGWLKGIPRYLYAALSAIYQGASWEAELEWDNGEYSGPISLVSVGNGARTGGLFYMTPHADLFDGELTFTFGYVKSRLRMLSLLPLAMKPGKGSFVEKEDMNEINTTRLSIKLKKLSPSHADGELFDEEVREVEYRIFPGRLTILMP